MNIDVFGGTGFIGKRFCDLYHEAEPHPRENNQPKYKNILYLISTTDNYNVLSDVHIDINTNLNKLMDVLQNCKDQNYIFNFISSWFVYGEGPIPAKENQPCHPKGFYSITKKCAEDLLISYCRTFNIKYRIFRLANVYGPNDKKVSKKKNALQYLINEIKANRNIDLYYGGEFIRDYIHIDDVCRAIKFLIENSSLNEIYNVGSGYPWKFKFIMDYIARKVCYTGTMNTIEPSEFHKIVQVKDFYLDITKLNNLGFKNKISIFDGLDKLL